MLKGEVISRSVKTYKIVLDVCFILQGAKRNSKGSYSTGFSEGCKQI
ncbi:hypothetical protein [Clostridium estertheticum]|nr:hypothetical protein [Clostridium estertheticum]MCB2362280.1 hypothetical protein [Clostridium estertheticum]